VFPEEDGETGLPLFPVASRAIPGWLPPRPRRVLLAFPGCPRGEIPLNFGKVRYFRVGGSGEHQGLQIRSRGECDQARVRFPLAPSRYASRCEAIVRRCAPTQVRPPFPPRLVHPH